MTNNLTEVLNGMVNEQGAIELNFETEKEEGLENIEMNTDDVVIDDTIIELPEVDEDDNTDDELSYENPQVAVILRNNIDPDDRIATGTAINNAMTAKSVYPESFDLLYVVATMTQNKKKGMKSVLNDIIEAIENKGKGYLKIIAKEAKERKTFRSMIETEILEMAYAEKVPYEFTEKFLDVYYKAEFNEELYDLFKSDKCESYNTRLYEIIEQGVIEVENVYKIKSDYSKASKEVEKELFDRLTSEYSSILSNNVVDQVIKEVEEEDKVEVVTEDKDVENVDPIEEGIKNLISSVEEGVDELSEKVGESKPVYKAKEVHQDASDYLGETVYKLSGEDNKVFNADGDMYIFSEASKRWNYTFSDVNVIK